MPPPYIANKAVDTNEANKANKAGKANEANKAIEADQTIEASKSSEANETFRPIFEAKGEKCPAPFVRLPLPEDLASIDSHDNNNSVLKGVVSSKENQTPRQRG
jgi:hypothetical protein